jgi:proteasome activator subunit 4
MTISDPSMSTLLDSGSMLPYNEVISVPFADGLGDIERRLSSEEEDILLKDTTASFADWVTSFIRRVIQLLENLPEEGEDGTAGGPSEGFPHFFFLPCHSSFDVSLVNVVDAVAGACSQICTHLSEPLFDLVLKTIF